MEQLEKMAESQPSVCRLQTGSLIRDMRYRDKARQQYHAMLRSNKMPYLRCT